MLGMWFPSFLSVLFTRHREAVLCLTAPIFGGDRCDDSVPKLEMEATRVNPAFAPGPRCTLFEGLCLSLRDQFSHSCYYTDSQT